MRLPGIAPAWLGVVLIDQLDPFHASAKVTRAEALMVDPTAVHAVAEGQDTALSTPSLAPVGLGVVWTDQLVPFQTSARVPLSATPTAVQALADGHDTPLSWL